MLFMLPFIMAGLTGGITWLLFGSLSFVGLAVPAAAAALGFCSGVAILSRHHDLDPHAEKGARNRWGMLG